MLLVITILDSVYGLIYTACTHITIWSPAINQNAKKHVLWPVQFLVFIIDLDPGWIENKSQLTGWTNFFKILKDNA